MVATSNLKKPEGKPKKERTVKVTFLDEDTDDNEERNKKLHKFSDQLARAIDDLRRESVKSSSKHKSEGETKKNPKITTGCHTRYLEGKRKQATPHSSLADTADYNKFWG